MALPGGRCDAGETLAQAALRELGEEIGLRPGADAVLGTLDDYPTRSAYLVTPVVVWAGFRPPMQVNPGEVASVHRIPLNEIARDDAVDFTTIPQHPARRAHQGRRQFDRRNDAAFTISSASCLRPHYRVAELAAGVRLAPGCYPGGRESVYPEQRAGAAVEVDPGFGSRALPRPG